MTIDELKVYAKKEFGISTRGINKKDDIIHLIEQYKVVASAKVKEEETEYTEEDLLIEIELEKKVKSTNGTDDKKPDEPNDESKKLDDDDMMKE